VRSQSSSWNGGGKIQVGRADGVLTGKASSFPERLGQLIGLDRAAGPGFAAALQLDLGAAR